ncbi:hypothetical protein ABK040_007996 [Willaertia magna]
MERQDITTIINSHWLSKVDTDSISVILSFLPLKDQLKFRSASKCFNEMVTERMTISKIVFDFINYWNKTIKQNNFTKIEEILYWTMGALSRCNGFIRNQQILKKEEIKKTFTENQLKLLQNGVIQVNEMISDKGLCEDDTFFSFCKIKWKVNNNDSNPKTITFIQNYLQCKNCKTLKLKTQYILKFYEDDNTQKTTPLILFNDSDNIVNYEALEKVRNIYCNQLVTKDLEDFCNFLLKLANSPPIRKPEDELQDYESNNIYEMEMESNYNEFNKNGVLQMDKFILKYNWKEFLSIFCNSLIEINHQMKSIVLNNNLVKNSKHQVENYFYELDEDDDEEEKEKEEKEKYSEEITNSVKLSIQSKLYKICDSKQEDRENNFNFDWTRFCKESNENREAIFYFSHLNKYIKIKSEEKSIVLYRNQQARKLQLFYKEVNENDWNCFYYKDNLNFKDNMKEIYYEKEMERKKLQPKRPPSGYLIFCAEKREIIKQQYPQMTVGELMKEMARLWKSLSDEEKMSYLEQYRVMKEKYKIELQEFEKRQLEEEEKEEKERECKREKLSVMDISKIKEMFELNVTDELFIEMLMKVIKAYTLVIIDGSEYFYNNNLQNINITI